MQKPLTASRGRWSNPLPWRQRGSAMSVVMAGGGVVRCVAMAAKRGVVRHIAALNGRGQSISALGGRGHVRCHGSGGGAERLAPPAGGAAQARWVRAVPARSRSRSSGAGQVERRRPRPSGECGGAARGAREGAGSVTDITRIPAPAATARQHRPGGPRGLRGWSGGAGPGTGLEKRGKRGEGPPEMERPEVRGGPVRSVPPGIERLKPGRERVRAEQRGRAVPRGRWRRGPA